MDKEQLIQNLQAQNLAIEIQEEPSQFLTVFVDTNNFHSTMKQLKENDVFQFNFLYNLTCVDYPEHMEMVYHLRATELDHEIVIKVKLENRDATEIETVYNIWPTAEFHEREVYDLFGVKFNNHPDLRRLLLDDDWKGHPLRKDYVDPVNMISLS